MRTKFIQVASRKEAQDRAPWAYAIVKVDGGFMAFESAEDLRTWKAQR